MVTGDEIKLQNYTANDRTPFVYLIGWSKHNLWYYGCRYGKGCHPNDLWTTYFTSSVKVQSYRESLLEEPNIVEIRRIFNSVDSCIRWEERILRKLKVVRDSKWINEHAGNTFSLSACAAGGKKGGALGGKNGGRKGILRQAELGIGRFAWTAEERSNNAAKAGAVSGNQHKLNGTGIFSFTNDQRIARNRNGGKVAGKLTYEKKIGIHGMTHDEKRTASRKGNEAKRHPVCIDEINYWSIGEAASILGLHFGTVKRRCLSEKFPNYSYIIVSEENLK